jgi:hypothetical protein
MKVMWITAGQCSQITTFLESPDHGRYIAKVAHDLYDYLFILVLNGKETWVLQYNGKQHHIYTTTKKKETKKKKKGG